jgi:acetyl esterase
MALDAASTYFITELGKRGGKPLQELKPAEARAGGPMMAAMFGAGPDLLRVDNTTLETPDGSSFRVRTLIPREEPAGVLVYFHGGGWVVGSIDEYEAAGRTIAASTGWAVVLVDYRKAPEYPYPAATDDAWQALGWAEQNLVAIAGRRVRLVVGGDSAGGNLAAVVSRRARDEAGPSIAAQVLVYPITNDDFDSPTYRDPANQLMLNRDLMIWFWNHYAEESVREDQDVSPLKAKDFSNLPAAIVLIAEHDVLRHEGEAYAAALKAAGVPVRQRVFPGQMHGFFHMVNVLPGSADGVSYLADELRALVPDVPEPAAGTGN